MAMGLTFVCLKYELLLTIDQKKFVDQKKSMNYW